MIIMRKLNWNMKDWILQKKWVNPKMKRWHHSIQGEVNESEFVCIIIKCEQKSKTTLEKQNTYKQ